MKALTTSGKVGPAIPLSLCSPHHQLPSPLPAHPTTHPTHPSSSTTGGQWPVLAAVGVLQPGPQLRPLAFPLSPAPPHTTPLPQQQEGSGQFWQLWEYFNLDLSSGLSGAIGSIYWPAVAAQLPKVLGLFALVCFGSCL